jgi:predicted ABC-type ATPase
LVVRQQFHKGRRLRIFAGPNGSGKSTVFNQVSSQFNIGIYINPDEIASKLILSKQVDLKDYELTSPLKISFTRFLKNSPLLLKAIKEGYTIDLELHSNVILCNSKIISYEPALLAEFIRENLLRLGKRITFETVLSHESKIDVFKDAIKRGYKNYLYFVGTDDPKINIDRVDQRVKQGGHAVSRYRIKDRYYKSMNLLEEAVANTYRTFLYDNSGKEAQLILEVFKGKEIIFHYGEVPEWVDTYFLQRINLS